MGRAWRAATPAWMLAASLAVGLLSLSTAGQVLPFEVLGVNQGLPQSQVTALAQDSDGYIWVGTWGGLARYNGDAFTYFRTEEDLPGNRIQELLAARDGTLWIATADGLAAWKRHALVVPADPLVSHVRCRALAEDADGTLWVGTDAGLVMRSGDGWRRVPVGAEETPRVYDLLPEKDGLLAVTQAGLAVVGASAPFAGPAAPEGTLRVAARTGDGLWVGTQGHGLWRWDGARWGEVPLEQGHEVDVYKLCTDGRGTLYVCTTNGGLYIRHQGDAGFTHWTMDNGLPSNVVNVVLRDREGNLWVGTDIGGLARLGSLAVTNYGTGQGLPSPCVFGLSRGRWPGTLWIGTLRGAVLYRPLPTPAALETIDASNGLPNELVWKVLQSPSGDLWVLTDTALMIRPAGSRALRELGARDGFPRGLTVDMALDGEGGLWLAGEDPQGGLCHRDPGGHWRRWAAADDGTPITNCRRLAVRKEGGVWVASEIGLLACDGETVHRLEGRPPIPSATVFSCLLEDSLGRLWVGNDGGLAVRETDGRWRLLNDTPGFDNRDVFSLVEDASGGIWVGTARGAYRFARDGTVQALTPEDGLAGFECNQGGFLADQDGGVWIGTVGGLSRYEPGREMRNAVPPRLVVESADYPGGREAFPKGLDLPWSGRNVTFHVGLLSYRARERCAYRARMEGLETDWIPLRRASELRYTNLPPGALRLILQAVNESGVWGEMVSLPVRIRPPFWMTWWFRLAGLLALVGAAVAGYRWRTHLLQRRNEELERIVAERTAELSLANTELERLATHESLTGLPNRRAILAHLRLELAPDHAVNRRFGVIITDLDHFKEVNDTLGHAAGDQVLAAMARTIQRALREGDRLGRYGGDEFLVVLPGADLSAVDAAANRISAIRETFDSGRHHLAVGVTCGGVAVPAGTRLEEEDILTAVDALLYEAKREGRGSCKVRDLASP